MNIDDLNNNILSNRWKAVSYTHLSAKNTQKRLSSHSSLFSLNTIGIIASIYTADISM